MLDFLLENEPTIREAIAIVAIFMIAFLTKQWHAACLRPLTRGLNGLGQRRGLSTVLLALFAIGASAALSLLGHMPEPRVHDEFSYLLAGDTFAHGRLTNLVHPLWIHFESFHVLQQPTYASKYPPAQGLMLAAGQVLGGHPIVGVWISTALACGAMYWMLLAWTTPRWALFGGLFTALYPVVLIEWGQSYWGGTVAMTGGALVFGALRRVVRSPRVRDSLVLGVGFAVLANSRPYEGLLVSLSGAAVLLTYILGKNGPPLTISTKRIILPILVVLVSAGGAMGFYNWRVTGSALRLPYQVYEATYSVTPIFSWRSRSLEPTYRNEPMRNYYATRRPNDNYTIHQSVEGLVTANMKKLKSLWLYYQGQRLRLTLTIPFLMLPWVIRQPWQGFAFFTCAVCMAGIIPETYTLPQYLAPITSLVLVFIVQGMRHLRLWRWRGRPMGSWLVCSLVMVTLASFGARFTQQLRNEPSGWEFQRARIVRQLKADGGQHLVLIRYGPKHLTANEWVYNGADIDGAAVVLAREMEPSRTCKLLNYFKERYVWLATIDKDRDHSPLTPYPNIACHNLRASPEMRESST